jgi:hypothetical protein
MLNMLEYDTHVRVKHSDVTASNIKVYGVNIEFIPEFLYCIYRLGHIKGEAQTSTLLVNSGYIPTIAEADKSLLIAGAFIREKTASFF